MRRASKGRTFAVLALLALMATGPAACEPEGGAAPCPAGLSPCGLVITEVFAEPEGANDGGQWIEVFNTTGETLDLRGLRLFLEYRLGENLQQKRHTIVAHEPVLLAPGQYGALSNGGWQEDDLWDYADRLYNLPSAGARVRLVCDDGTEIDSVCFGAPCEAPEPGFAFPEERSLALVAPPTGEGEAGACALRGEAPLAGRWAVAAPSRGATNPAVTPLGCCPRPPDGAPVQGLTADLLRLTEAFANPAGADTGAEWLELFVDLPAGTWLDATGLRLNTDVESPSGGHVVSPLRGCTLWPGGGHVVLAGELALVAAPERACFTLGGAPVAQILEGLTLGNTEGRVVLWGPEGEDLARFDYGVGHEARASQWDEGRWCPATRPYTEDDDRFGSPGAPNPACGSAWCRHEGALVEARQPAAGELVLTEIMADVPGAEREGVLLEWFEALLLPETDGPRDLAGLRVHKELDDAGKAVSSPVGDCARVAPGHHVLFAVSAAPEENGGLPAVDAIYEKLPNGLKNDGGYLALRRGDGVLVDEVLDYGDSQDGVARQLAPAALRSAAPAEANDEAGAWCHASAPYGTAGGLGSPGAANTDCESER